MLSFSGTSPTPSHILHVFQQRGFVVKEGGYWTVEEDLQVIVFRVY